MSEDTGESVVERPVSADVKGACYCPRHAKQVTRSGRYEGPCDKPSWRGGDGTLYGCDTFTNPERAARHASRILALSEARLPARPTGGDQ